MIDTPGGPVPVERLRVGDRVLAHGGDDGSALAPQAIVWIGHRSYRCVGHPRPELIWPVRVAAGALGTRLPRRDLFLSSLHGLFVEGVLVPVQLLVNGHSIKRVPVASIDYFHVQLPAHAVLLAEGVEAESYLDTDDHATFVRRERGRRSADYVAQLWEAAGCARLILCGPELQSVRASLGSERRISMLGRRPSVREGPRSRS